MSFSEKLQESLEKFAYFEMKSNNYGIADSSNYDFLHFAFSIYSVSRTTAKVPSSTSAALSIQRAILICHFHTSLSDAVIRNPSPYGQKYESLYVICSRRILMEQERRHKAATVTCTLISDLVTTTASLLTHNADARLYSLDTQNAMCRRNDSFANVKMTYFKYEKSFGAPY